ncbi:MAG: hypothetical protein KDI42_06485 [Gammaproteobacteria bacterium]|nr:hypothetical protein [Gammaproteobacteria bacterium]
MTSPTSIDLRTTLIARHFYRTWSRLAHAQTYRQAAVVENISLPFHTINKAAYNTISRLQVCNTFKHSMMLMADIRRVQTTKRPLIERPFQNGLTAMIS